MIHQLLGSILLLGGIMPVSATDIDAKLKQAYLNKGPEYQVRTQHIDQQGQPHYINRLILESSPYLLQHAHNPVNWYPWGKEAFEQAKLQDKPIFLSIGYSTCHWCHVMEEESFDNEQTADLMNASFINIKVDREQRPEIDELYMTAVSLMTGHGGWPMSSFLNHEGKTFWAGTYLPPVPFKELLGKVDQAWQQHRDEVEKQADEVANAVQKLSQSQQQSEQIDLTVSQQAVEQMMASYDDFQGGFSQAPKFPNEPGLILLLDHFKRTGDTKVLEAIETTLKAMAQGGLYDQIGGGFHRYSTDNEWLVPHFEKMLYNQSQLVRVYLQAYTLTKNPLYARVAEQTLDYVLRDMTSPEGGFYSATDADSEGEEGSYFVWTKEQIANALTDSEAKLAIDLFGVTDDGNFEGKNILYLTANLASYADEHQYQLDDLLNDLDTIITKLRKVRQQRSAPLRDEKIITAWNAMMMTALVEASEVLQQPRYRRAAERNLALLVRHNQISDGELWRIHLNDHSSIAATQEDYAYLIEALITLYDQSQNEQHLDWAQTLADSMIKRFWDDNAGGFYMDISSDTPTMARVKQSSDSAIPSGNAVAFNDLVMLTKRTDELQFATKANETLAAFSQFIRAMPAAYSYFLYGVNKQRAGEIASRRYAAHGAVSVFVDKEPLGQKQRLILTIKIKDNWHINAHQPLGKDLIATSVELSDIIDWQIDQVVYPSAVKKQLGFSKSTLAVYQGDIQIEVILSAKSSIEHKMIPLVVKLQACNDQVCLAPEAIHFKLAE